MDIFFYGFDVLELYRPPLPAKTAKVIGLRFWKKSVYHEITLEGQKYILQFKTSKSETHKKYHFKASAISAPLPTKIKKQNFNLTMLQQSKTSLMKNNQQETKKKSWYNTVKKKEWRCLSCIAGLIDLWQPLVDYTIPRVLSFCLINAVSWWKVSTTVLSFHPIP